MNDIFMEILHEDIWKILYGDRFKHQLKEKLYFVKKAKKKNKKFPIFFLLQKRAKSFSFFFICE